MRKKRFVRLLGFLTLCIACLWAAGGSVRAVEQREVADKVEKKKVSYDAALRKYFKNQGMYLGKSNHCYYTYAKNIFGNSKNGVVIVGLQETVKEIRIPDKIKGKKVVAIYLVGLNEISSNYENEDLAYSELLSIKEKSRTSSIVIPMYVSDIHDDSVDQVYFLKNLKKFKVSPKNIFFSSKSGVLFTKDRKTLLNYPDRRGASKYRIPKGVTDISEDSFRRADVRQVVMPDTVKIIAPGAFGYSRIEKVSLSKNLKCIQSGAFEGSRLKKISLPKKLKKIEVYAFQDTQLREIVIPGKVKEIPDFCFDSCKKLKKVAIKDGVKIIGERAFLYCYQLRKVTIPSSVKKIKDDPFAIDPCWDIEYDKGDIDPETKDQMAWRNAGVIIYAKKGCYAYREFNKKYWREKLGIKVKAM